MYLLSFVLEGLSALLRHLRLSISSINFYKDIFENYRGYGIRYLFVISFIPTLIYCIFILYAIISQNHFNNPYLSKATEKIKYIIDQLPEIKYANSKISVEKKEPIYIYSINNIKVAVIDTNNQVSNSEKKKIPYILEAHRLTINWVTTSIFKYSEMFKSKEVIITPEIVKEYCLTYAPNLLIYLVMPAILLLFPIIFLLQKSFIILLVYILANLYKVKTSMQTCIRLVIFSSGVPVLLQPIVILLFPAFSEILQLLQIFITGLLLMAIWQIPKDKKFSSYL